MSAAVEPRPPYMSSAERRTGALDFVALFKPRITFFQVLTTDFYRPLRLGAIHAALYPGEYFNPVSSPALSTASAPPASSLARTPKFSGTG